MNVRRYQQELGKLTGEWLSCLCVCVCDMKQVSRWDGGRQWVTQWSEAVIRCVCVRAVVNVTGFKCWQWCSDILRLLLSSLSPFCLSDTLCCSTLIHLSFTHLRRLGCFTVPLTVLSFLSMSSSQLTVNMMCSSSLSCLHVVPWHSDLLHFSIIHFLQSVSETQSDALNQTFSLQGEVW